MSLSQLHHHDSRHHLKARERLQREKKLTALTLYAAIALLAMTLAIYFVTQPL